jgi:uncharacterized membrane protein
VNELELFFLLIADISTIFFLGRKTLSLFLSLSYRVMMSMIYSPFFFEKNDIDFWELSLLVPGITVGGAFLSVWLKWYIPLRSLRYLI